MGSSQSRWNVVVVVVNISITIALPLSSSFCTKSAHRKQTDISMLQPSAAFGCTKLLHSHYCLSTILASQKKSNFQQLSNSDFLIDHQRMVDSFHSSQLRQAFCYKLYNNHNVLIWSHDVFQMWEPWSIYLTREKRDHCNATCKKLGQRSTRVSDW